MPSVEEQRQVQPAPAAATLGQPEPKDHHGWWPWGKDDDDDDKSEPDGEKGEAKEDKSKEEKSGALHGLVQGFKDLGTKMRGKSHRFSDFLALHKEVQRDLANTETYPEILKEAHLRRDNKLSSDEADAMLARKKWIASSGALKAFLQLDEDVHPDDVPIIGLGGSGGGYRACLGFLSAIEEMQQKPDGTQSEGGALWDLVSYCAGVSGSCWTIGAMYTFASLQASWLLDHFAATSAHHPLSLKAIDKVARSAHGIYFQLAPLLQKLKLGMHPGPLDLYGTLVTSHIFFSPLTPPNGGSLLLPRPPAESTTGQDDEDLVEVNQESALKREYFQFSRAYDRMDIKGGRAPLPILTAVRHERPWKDWKSPTEAFDHADHAGRGHDDPHAWWQWFEVTPCEFGSDELEGWIPTWSFGRTFDKGVSTQKTPERSLSLLLGIATSAPAGPLAAWLGTLYRNLPKGAMGSKIRHMADEWVEKNPLQAERIAAHHPVHAQNEANPFFGAEVQEGRGNGFENSPRIHLVDAGMGNNLPTWSFFRPGREVDLMLLGDYSSDVQKGEALERIQDFGRDKGLEIKPRVELPALGEWPTDTDEEGKPVPRQLSAAQIAERFDGRYAQILDARPLREEERNEDEGATYERDGVRYNKRHQPQAQRPTTLIYLPLLPNAVQPDYDPSTAPFSSSYNLQWTDEQVNTIRKTSRANVVDGLDVIRKAVRDVYERKKAERLARDTAPAHS